YRATPGTSALTPLGGTLPVSACLCKDVPVCECVTAKQAHKSLAKNLQFAIDSPPLQLHNPFDINNQ
ncbi:MAG TPA: hypothetical protein PKN82_04235, partial [Thauera sp.]|nr:hypothetical protein [Thauera sp.]HNS91849.1 hypothetical protein [Thauera sp.]